VNGLWRWRRFWGGYRRVQGELNQLGIKVAPSTVWEVLVRAGVLPAPRRVSESWSDFLRAQAAGIVACDFVSVDSVFLRRLYAFVFIECKSRIVHIAGVTANPTGEWVTQRARDVMGVLTERVKPLRFLIHDRGTTFTCSFDEVFRSEGVQLVRTPVRAPRANAFMERWFGTLRRECLDGLLIVGRRHLEAVLRDYASHYKRPPPASLARPARAEHLDDDPRADQRRSPLCRLIGAITPFGATSEDCPSGWSES
jgi:putative transposase